MSTYTFQPTDDPYTASNWADPRSWAENMVPNGMDADVLLPPVTQVSTGQPVDAGLQIQSGASFQAHSIGIDGDSLVLAGLLDVQASVTDHGTIYLFGGALSAGTIENTGYVVGFGTISATNFVNNGTLTGGSLSTLATGQLTINAASFSGSGSISTGIGNLTIATSPGGFSGLVSGLLTGSYHTSDDMNYGSNNIYLDVGGTITSTSAQINLENGGIFAKDPNTGQYVSIQSTLHEIQSGGHLTTGVGTYAFGNLQIDGQVNLNGTSLSASQLSIGSSGSTALANGPGAFNTGGIYLLTPSATISAPITIAEGGSLSGVGGINGPVVNNGSILSQNLSISGALTGTGMTSVAADSTYIAYSNKIILPSLEIGANSTGNVFFNSAQGQLILDDARSYTGTITTTLPASGSNAPGDAIILKGVTLSSVSGVSYSGSASGGTLSLERAAGSINLHFAGNFTISSFTVSPAPQTLSTDPQAVEITVCFASGTLIRTVCGNLPVERLSVGDMVVTNSGQARRLIWIGSRHMTGIADPKHKEAWPVRVATDAFGPGLPCRDLLLSAGHSVCTNVLGEVFIPVGRLANGATIEPFAVDEVTYWHLELDSHDVLLANDLPAESYRNIGNRGWFVGSRTLPCEDDSDNSAPSARPIYLEGPVVEAVRMRLAERAREIGWTSSPEMDPHLVVDGVRINGQCCQEKAVFTFPSSARSVSITSSTFVLAHSILDEDPRHLGLCLTRVALRQGDEQPVIMSLLSEGRGLHQLEREGDKYWRWTDGQFELPRELWMLMRSPVTLELDLIPNGIERWIPPSDQKEQVFAGNLPGASQPCLHSIAA